MGVPAVAGLGFLGWLMNQRRQLDAQKQEAQTVAQLTGNISPSADTSLMSKVTDGVFSNMVGDNAAGKTLDAVTSPVQLFLPGLLGALGGGGGGGRAVLGPDQLPEGVSTSYKMPSGAQYNVTGAKVSPETRAARLQQKREETIAAEEAQADPRAIAAANARALGTEGDPRIIDLATQKASREALARGKADLTNEKLRLGDKEWQALDSGNIYRKGIAGAEANVDMARYPQNYGDYQKAALDNQRNALVTIAASRPDLSFGGLLDLAETNGMKIDPEVYDDANAAILRQRAQALAAQGMPIDKALQTVAAANQGYVAGFDELELSAVGKGPKVDVEKKQEALHRSREIAMRIRTDPNMSPEEKASMMLLERTKAEALLRDISGGDGGQITQFITTPDGETKYYSGPASAASKLLPQQRAAYTNQKMGAAAFIANADMMLKLIKEDNPSLGSWKGTFDGFMQTARANLRSFDPVTASEQVKETFRRMETEGTFTPKQLADIDAGAKPLRYEDVFKPEMAAWDTLKTVLTYAHLQANEPGGRYTDKDWNNAQASLFGGSGPDTIVKINTMKQSLQAKIAQLDTALAADEPKDTIGPLLNQLGFTLEEVAPTQGKGAAAAPSAPVDPQQASDEQLLYGGQ